MVIGLSNNIRKGATQMPITYQRLGNSGMIKATITFDHTDANATSTSSMAYAMTGLSYNGEYAFVGASSLKVVIGEGVDVAGHTAICKYGTWYFDFMVDNEFSETLKEITLLINGTKFVKYTSTSIPSDVKLQCDVYLMKM